MSLSDDNCECYNEGDYYEDEPTYECDEPYKYDESEIEEESDDYMRDDLGYVVKTGRIKVKREDMNFAFSKKRN